MEIRTALDRDTVISNIQELFPPKTFTSLPMPFSGSIKSDQLFMKVNNGFLIMPWRGAFYGRIFTSDNGTVIRGKFRPNYAQFFIGLPITAIIIILLLIETFEQSNETSISLLGGTVCILITFWYTHWVISTDRTLIIDAICNAIRGNRYNTTLQGTRKTRAPLS